MAWRHKELNFEVSYSQLAWVHLKGGSKECSLLKCLFKPCLDFPLKPQRGQTQTFFILSFDFLCFFSLVLSSMWLGWLMIETAMLLAPAAMPFLSVSLSLEPDVRG